MAESHQMHHKAELHLERFFKHADKDEHWHGQKILCPTFAHEKIVNVFHKLSKAAGRVPSADTSLTWAEYRFFTSQKSSRKSFLNSLDAYRAEEKKFLSMEEIEDIMKETSRILAENAAAATLAATAPYYSLDLSTDKPTTTPTQKFSLGSSTYQKGSWDLKELDTEFVIPDFDPLQPATKPLSLNLVGNWSGETSPTISLSVNTLEVWNTTEVGAGTDNGNNTRLYQIFLPALLFSTKANSLQLKVLTGSVSVSSVTITDQVPLDKKSTEATLRAMGSLLAQLGSSTVDLINAFNSMKGDTDPTKYPELKDVHDKIVLMEKEWNNILKTSHDTVVSLATFLGQNELMYKDFTNPNITQEQKLSEVKFFSDQAAKELDKVEVLRNTLDAFRTTLSGVTSQALSVIAASNKELEAAIQELDGKILVKNTEITGYQTIISATGAGACVSLFMGAAAGAAALAGLGPLAIVGVIVGIVGFIALLTTMIVYMTKLSTAQSELKKLQDDKDAKNAQLERNKVLTQKLNEVDQLLPEIISLWRGFTNFWNLLNSQLASILQLATTILGDIFSQLHWDAYSKQFTEQLTPSLDMLRAYLSAFPVYSLKE